MSYPCLYNEEGKCRLHSTVYEHSWCVEGPCEDQTLSNGDRIRAMSDKEKAEFFTLIQQDAYNIGDRMRSIDEALYPTSTKAWIEWLKQPAEA